MIVPRGGEAAPQSARRRLFFALWPDEGCRAQLERAAEVALTMAAGRAGRPVPPDDWHATLCFLGAVPEALLPALQAGAARLRAPGFALRLQRLRYWEETGVLALLGDCPPAAAALAAALRSLSRELGLAPDDKPLRPHITLVRGLRAGTRQGVRAAGEQPADGTALDITLQAGGFDLAESLVHVAAPAARYRRLAGWPLGT